VKNSTTLYAPISSSVPSAFSERWKDSPTPTPHFPGGFSRSRRLTHWLFLPEPDNDSIAEKPQYFLRVWLAGLARCENVAR
jgi:hypothetical protein